MESKVSFFKHVTGRRRRHDLWLYGYNNKVPRSCCCCDWYVLEMKDARDHGCVFVECDFLALLAERLPRLYGQNFVKTPLWPFVEDLVAFCRTYPAVVFASGFPYEKERGCKKAAMTRFFLSQGASSTKRSAPLWDLSWDTTPP